MDKQDISKLYRPGNFYVPRYSHASYYDCIFLFPYVHSVVHSVVHNVVHIARRMAK
jgi:hypothetical protein